MPAATHNPDRYAGYAGGECVRDADPDSECDSIEDSNSDSNPIGDANRDLEARHRR